MTPDAAADAAFRLAVAGDIHVYRPCVNPLRLMNKRMVAQVNAWLNPNRRFDETLLPGMVDRVRALAPDLFVLSGDLTVSSLPAEFAVVRDALEPLRGEVPTLAVAGNHDRYTWASTHWRTMERVLGDAAEMPESFPQLRRLTDRWSLLALDSARPHLFNSRGKLGARQLGEAMRLVRGLPEGSGLVVLCHYAWRPRPGKTSQWNHRLVDAEGLTELFRACTGPVVFVHGHIHMPWQYRAGDARLEHVVDINVGSPTRRSEEWPLGQGFWEFDLPADSAQEVALIHHRADDGGHWTQAATAWPA